MRVWQPNSAFIADDIIFVAAHLQETALPVDLIVVRDGQEAVHYLLREGSYATDPRWRHPDLILLDLNLPRLTGREVLDRIRASDSLRATPVVVLTTSRLDQDVREMYAAGANTYIEKPPDFRRFVEVLEVIQRYWLHTALLPTTCEKC